MRFDDALISRETHPLGSDEVEIIEVWNPNHPSCPFFSWHWPKVGPREIFGWRTVLPIRVYEANQKDKAK